MPTQPPVKPILANYFSNKLIQAKIVNESLLLDDDDDDDIVVCVQEYNQTHSLLSTDHYGMFHHGKENVEGMDDFVDAADKLMQRKLLLFQFKLVNKNEYATFYF